MIIVLPIVTAGVLIVLLWIYAGVAGNYDLYQLDRKGHSALEVKG